MTQTEFTLRNLSGSLEKHSSGGRSYQSILKYKQKFIPPLIIFLVMQNVGFKAIKYLCREILGVFLTETNIREIVCSAADNASDLLMRSDKVAGEKVTAMQVDATWKGRKHKFFAAIDQTYHYLFEFKEIRGENEKSLAPVFKRINSLCFNLKYVISDMAPVYGGLVENYMALVKHLECNVHAIRSALRKLTKSRQKLARSSKQKKKALVAVKHQKSLISRSRKASYSNQAYRNKLVKEKKRNEVILDGLLNTNRQTMQGIKTARRIIRRISERINKNQKNLWANKKEAIEHLAKVVKLNSKYDMILSKYYSKDAQYMLQCRFIACFRRLLYTTDKDIYTREKLTLQKMVKGREDGVSKEIRSLFSRHPKLFRVESVKQSDPQFYKPINTNLVEGLFSQSRIMLDGLRNTPNTPYIRSRFVLFRYWHNYVGPLSGSDSGYPPIKRIEMSSPKNNPIQTICPSIEII